MGEEMLHPPVEPFDRRHITVGDGHELYVEQSGAKDAIPILFLHGGPGGSVGAWQRRFFDPKVYRAVLFDQRGCGQSRPRLALHHNTTDHLIRDIEMIRDTLGIERWALFGGSWGSTLALAYAQAFPKRVQGMVLRGVFLGEDEEVEWAFSQAARCFRPELWDQLRNLLDPDEQAKPIQALGKRMEDSDPHIVRAAAWIWHDYESILSRIDASGLSLPSSIDAAASKKGMPTSPSLEWHYIQHHFFLRPNQLIKQCDRLRHLPGWIVQGRYDLVCPPSSAFRLAKAWGGACHLRMVEDAGHSADHPPLMACLIDALGKLAIRLQ